MTIIEKQEKGKKKMDTYKKTKGIVYTNHIYICVLISKINCKYIIRPK